MEKRITRVDSLKIISLSYSSISEIGDTNIATPKSRDIAAQKEGAGFKQEAFYFSDYPIFQQKKVTVELNKPPVRQKHYHHIPSIFVNDVEVISVSASSLVQLGSLNTLDAESRTKLIRVLSEEKETI